MKSESSIFYMTLMNDVVFKTLWLKGSEGSKKYLYRIIKYVVGYDVSDFELRPMELPIDNKYSIANRVDILLESKDKLKKINIELNPINSKSLRNKNNTYLFKLAGEFYGGDKKDKYKEDINVEQINLNGFYYVNNNDVFELNYKLYDKKHNLELKSIRINDIYLPAMRDLCYNNDKEIYLDFAMFMAKSYEEMKEYAKGNKERGAVMTYFERMLKDEGIPSYDYNEFLEAVKAEEKEAGFNEGVKEGIKEGSKNIISSFLSSGMSKEQISEITKIPLKEINNMFD